MILKNISKRFANYACIQFLITRHDIEKKEDTVFGVGCRERDVGSVVCRIRKLRSDRESRDCVGGMTVWRPDG
jgi:hypothetical protein